MKESLFLVLAASVALLSLSLKAETLLDLPVSAVGNAAYLTSLSERPWWNAAWTRRAPLLVSSASEVSDAKAVVDVVVDFGETVEPKDVRVITPWETEIPCVAEPRGGTKVELLFPTPFRICENKPFLVYWGRGKGDGGRGKTEAPRTYLTLNATEDEFRLANGCIEVVFDRKARTPGPIKVIRPFASQAGNELLRRATGYAWTGFVFSAGGVRGLSNGVVTADNAFKKEIRFENGSADVYFTLYADAPRLDWRYELKKGVSRAKVEISWAVGGDTADDDLVYQGTAGKALLLRACIDQATCHIPQPEYLGMARHLSEGWLAIQDHRTHEAVGVLFDRAALDDLNYRSHGQALGELMTLSFAHAPSGDAVAEQRGALVARMGCATDVRTEYRRVCAPLVASVGAVQARRECPQRRPDLARDFVVDYNLGFGPGMGWLAGDPLDDPAWADNIVCRMRSYGANVARPGCIVNYAPYMKLSKDLYDRLKAAATRPGCSRAGERWPEWSPERYDGRRLSEYAAAAHRRGMSVSNWSTYLCFYWNLSLPGMYVDPELNALDRELQVTFPDCGVDVVKCLQACTGEEPYPPKDVAGGQGPDYWRWKDPSVYFDKVVDAERERLKACYADAKRRHPQLPVMVFNSENGEISREKFMSEMIGSFDSAYVEILPNGKMHHCKYAVKRLRALFDNEAGRTLHHHFYFYGRSERARIDEVEMPFMCGINGFSTENLSYEQQLLENSEIPADFYRFAEYTRLGAKAARMAPVRDLAVFRDGAAFRADVCARRTVGNNKWDTYACGDRRVAAFGHVPNLAWDIVVNRYFRRDALAKYRVVYLPSDEVFSDALAEELLAYVKAGGGAVIEGVTATNAVLAALALGDGEVRAVGKGKMTRLAKNLSETLATGGASAWAELRRVIASVGAKQPYAFGSEKFDSILQASEEGMLLSVYNFDCKETLRDVFTLAGEQPKDAYVLDLKAGVRKPFTGSFEVAAGPRQMAYYLIGSAAFTALPVVVPATSVAGVASVAPKGAECQPLLARAFRPAVALELVPAGSDGRPVKIRRSYDAMVTHLAYCEIDVPTFVKALKKATYVHFQLPTAAWDGLFATCGDELRAFLKRGGALFFDKRHAMPGKHAHAFLESVGVKDPTPSLSAGVGDGRAGWDITGETATNSLIYAKITARDFLNGLNYTDVFGTWDRATQIVPYRPYVATDHAVTIAQEGVLGKGRVVFSSLGFVFTDFYDNRQYGDAVLSWLIGMPVAQHAECVRALNGGPGEPVE